MQCNVCFSVGAHLDCQRCASPAHIFCTSNGVCHKCEPKQTKAIEPDMEVTSDAVLSDGDGDPRFWTEEAIDEELRNMVERSKAITLISAPDLVKKRRSRGGSVASQGELGQPLGTASPAGATGGGSATAGGGAAKSPIFSPPPASVVKPQVDKGACRREAVEHFMGVTGTANGVAEQCLSQVHGDLETALQNYYQNTLDLPTQLLYLSPADPLYILISGKIGTATTPLAHKLRQVICDATGGENCIVTTFETAVRRAFSQKPSSQADFAAVVPTLKDICAQLKAQMDDFSPSVVIIPDLRHPCEIEEMRKLTKSLFLIRVTASDTVRLNNGWLPDPERDQHITETALDNFKSWNLVFEDEGTGYKLIQWISERLFPGLARALSREVSEDDVK